MLHETGIPILMVTHDPEEALSTADSIYLLSDDGKLHQSGTPQTLYYAPSDLFTAEFFGEMNCFACVVKGDTIKTPLGEYPNTYDRADGEATLAVRPEGIDIAETTEGHSTATVESVHKARPGWLITARLAEGRPVKFHLIRGIKPEIGATLPLKLLERHVFVF
jgi:iron(III) transport system ATP-binding protein